MPQGGNPPLALSLSGAVARVDLIGEWTIEDGRGLVNAVDGLLAGADLAPANHAIVDLSRTVSLDTTGSFLVHRLLGGLKARGVSHEIVNSRPEQARLLDRLAATRVEAVPKEKKRTSVTDALAEIGELMMVGVVDVTDAMVVFGRIMTGLGQAATAVRRVRIASVVHHVEQAGLNAVPIVALMSFLIGAIIAQQGAFQMRAFGAEIFTVDLVGILVLREIGVLLTAIMVAGRSGSAFTAEIGSMKMREEIDALKIIGLDPVEILALPRVMALIIALPLLTFIADMAAILGAMLVSMTYSGIEPSLFLERLRDAADFSTLIVGFLKAPFMALVIGLVACVEGFRVEGSAESLGRHTTAAVVKSIFMVIVMDGIFAMYFAAIDL